MRQAGPEGYTEVSKQVKWQSQNPNSDAHPPFVFPIWSIFLPPIDYDAKNATQSLQCSLVSFVPCCRDR